MTSLWVKETDGSAQNVNENLQQDGLSFRQMLKSKGKRRAVDFRFPLWPRSSARLIVRQPTFSTAPEFMRAYGGRFRDAARCGRWSIRG
jgi:hypothetical protein